MNYTILEKNTIDGFAREDTKELYLRGAQKDELRAFKMACEWEGVLRPFLCVVADAAASVYGDQLWWRPEAVDEAIEYIRNRQFFRYFPNQ